MKTIALISHWYIENYDFEALIKPSDNLIAFVAEPFVKHFPAEKRKYFNKIIPMPMPKNNFGPLIQFDRCTLEKSITDILSTSELNASFDLICVNELNMVIAAELREKFNLRGPRKDDILKFRNKIIMKDILKNTDILTPTYSSFNSELAKSQPAQYYMDLKKSLGEKFVLKPISYAGSFGVYIIECKNDFHAFLDSKLYEKHEYEAETFVDGTLYHCDLALKAGEVIFAECCEYSCPNHDFSKGNVIASLIMPDESSLKARMLDVGIKALSYMGAKNGVFHIELFVDANNNIYFLEAAARPAGGLAARMYEIMYQANLFTIDLAIQLKRRPPTIKRNNQYSLQALIPMNQNIIDAFKRTHFQSDVDATWLIDHERVMGDYHSASVADVAAKIILCSKQYDEIKHDFLVLQKLGQVKC